MSYQQKEIKFNHQINSSGQLSMSPFTYIFKQSTNKKKQTNKQTNHPTNQPINKSTNKQTFPDFLFHHQSHVYFSSRMDENGVCQGQ